MNLLSLTDYYDIKSSNILLLTGENSDSDEELFLEARFNNFEALQEESLGLRRFLLINLISSLQFVDDGYMNRTTCPESGGAYVLLCKSFYDNFLVTEALPQSPALIGEDSFAYLKNTSILMILFSKQSPHNEKKYFLELPEEVINGIENS